MVYSQIKSFSGNDLNSLLVGINNWLESEKIEVTNTSISSAVPKHLEGGSIAIHYILITYKKR